MKSLLGLVIACAALAGLLACYPHGPNDCKPNDASCLPCTDVRNTNPACPPFPSDARKPDGGTTR